MTKNHGIPTTYRGTRFRSRLEARWAAFFDLVNWPWAYEPIDLDGWIPDFVLGANLDNGICCEIKPIDFTGMGRDALIVAWQPYSQQIERAQEAAKSRGGMILLGARPFWTDLFPEFPNLRKLCFAKIGVSFWPSYEKYTWPESLSRREMDGQFDFVIEREPYRGAITGDVFDHFEDGIDEFVFITSCINPIWTQAGNIVQWRGVHG